MKRAKSGLRLRDCPTGRPKHITDKHCKRVTEECLHQLQELQDKLYAEQLHGLLIGFQAMDGAGKDGTIKHVMSGLNPQGCLVSCFKQPTSEELGHDFLWRIQSKLPVKGQISILNRTHYEEVLIVRVHSELLAKERIQLTPSLWEDRFKQIRQFESHLASNGTVIIKFFLHISKKEQKKRFLARLELPEHNWKFSSSDLKEREYWADYQSAYQAAIRATSTKQAPWYVIPADDKLYAHMLIAQILLEKMKAMKPKYPTVPPERQAEIKKAKAILFKKAA